MCLLPEERDTHGRAGADTAAVKPAVVSQVLGAVPVREPARRGPGPAPARVRSAPPASAWWGRARRVCVTEEKTVAEELSDLPGATWSCFMAFRSAASIPGAGSEAPPGQASRLTARGFFVHVWTMERRLQPGPHLTSGPERGVRPGPVTRRGLGTEPGRSNDPMRLPRQSHQSPELSPELISFLERDMLSLAPDSCSCSSRPLLPAKAGSRSRAPSSPCGARGARSSRGTESEAWQHSRRVFLALGCPLWARGQAHGVRGQHPGCRLRSHRLVPLANH